jgi:hypothetical protein
MKKFSMALVAIATALAISPVALAQNYNFTYTDGNVTATGVLDTTSLGGGIYGITGGTIALTVTAGSGIAGTGVILSDPNGPGNLYTLQNPPNSGGANLQIDNLFYPGLNPELTDNGFNFELTNTAYAGGIFGSIWGNSASNYGIFEGNYNVYDSGAGNFSSSAVPDGGTTLLLLGLAVAGLAGLRRKLSA